MLVHTRFDNIRDNQPKPVTQTWDEFARSLGPHRHNYSAKLDAPLYSCVTYAPGATRGTDGVTSVTALVFDIDNKPADLFRLVLAEVDGLDYIVYTTWQHVYFAPMIRARLIVRLSRPLLPSEYEIAWQTMNARLHFALDTHSADIAHIYFVPSAPVGTEANQVYHVARGVPLDVDTLLSDPTPPTNLPDDEQPTELPLRLERLRRHAVNVSRSKSEIKSELGSILRLVCDGEVFATPGERDTTIFRLCSYLAEIYPTHSARSIAAHFAPSLQLMAKDAPDCPTVNDVAYKLRRAQAKQLAERAANAQFSATVLRSRILEAFGGTRADPYTPQEIARFNTPFWLVQHGRSYYPYFNGSYRGPYVAEAAAMAVIRDLAPAISAGVTLHTTDPNGNQIRKPLPTLIEQYGTLAERSCVSYLTDHTYYDLEDRTIVETAAQKRTVQPRYHEQISTWLSLATPPEQLIHLYTWIKYADDLSRPFVALILDGAPGTGKTFFATALARLWSLLGPVDANDAFGNFNEALSRCPIVLADETLPVDHMGRVLTAQFRTAIQAQSRPYRRKYVDVSTLIGAIRLIVTTNNADQLLSAFAGANADDLRAIADRCLRVKFRREAAKFLSDQPTTEWLERDMVLEHFAYIRATHPIKAVGRFGIPISQEDPIRIMLATRTFDTTLICQWLVGFILNQRLLRANQAAAPYALVEPPTTLLVNPRAVHYAWSQYVQDARVPTVSRIADMIQPMTKARVKRNGIRYSEIDLNYLITWAERSDFSTSEQILTALAEPPAQAVANVLPLRPPLPIAK